MGKFVMTDVRLFTGGADLTSASNKVEVKAEVEEKDATNYASGGYKELLGGLASAEIAGEGQWEAGDPGLVDNATWEQLGGVGPWTIGPRGPGVDSLAYFTNALRADYKVGDAVGEIAPWASSGKSSWPLVRGVFVHPPGIARTASGTGTSVNLGAVPAGKRLYAALHVLSAAGTTPSLTARIQSDDAPGFGSPTTRLTFNAASAGGGQILRTDSSAITDTWWQIAWTITGTTPSFLFAAAVGIY
ncbi:hypothetical protein [Streptomyces phaeochromogenes]|uniref:hypothetical protein n=1 Tax=Streptomyces phaeochromogenes TaxID=1923 RepID=UPI002DD833BF|nr:hypothetical protein [Streptomyces phaeochromogenes]WRZ31338.1 hypothetical protein OG931_28140 [Streptomyces phaeochromogenes]